MGAEGAGYWGKNRRQSFTPDYPFNAINQIRIDKVPINKASLYRQ